MNQYEAMFLFDPTFANDFADAKAEIDRLLGRAGAEIVFCEKWEERKLAYEIKGRKRGVYVLTYFKCDGEKITALERDAQISESLLRLLVKRADGVTREQIERFMPERKREDDGPKTESKPDAKPDSKSDSKAESKPEAKPAAESTDAPAPEAKPEGAVAVAESDADSPKE